MLKMLFPLLTLLPLLLLSPNTIWLFLPSFLLILTPLSLSSMYTPLLSQTVSPYSFMDPLNIPLMILSIWISALMFLSSKNVFLSNLSYKPFSFWILLLLIFLLLAFSTNNMIMFYIMFESTLIPTLILILGWGYQPERLQASFYFILYTITASLPLLISILIIYSNSGHTFLFMQWFIPKVSQNILSMWWTLTCFAFMVKLPLFLVHLWLPKAHVEAPVAGSMILAAILLKLGGYGLVRTSLAFLPTHFFPTSLFMSISLWGAIISSIICLRQTDLKALIAYSSVSHMGMLIAGTMTLSTFGFYGAICMMIAHGLSSSALFSIANSTYEATNTRSLYISKGLAMIAPHLALWWFLLSAANMAAPPSINLFSEIILIISIIASSLHTWTPVAFITFLSATYSLYLYSASQHGQPPQFLAPLNLYSSNTYTTLTLHLIPIIFLTLKPETMLLL